MKKLIWMFENYEEIMNIVFQLKKLNFTKYRFRYSSFSWTTIINGLFIVITKLST